MFSLGFGSARARQVLQAVVGLVDVARLAGVAQAVEVRVTAEIIIEDTNPQTQDKALGAANAQTKTPVEVLKELGTIAKVVTEVPATETEPANEPEAVPVKSVSLFG